MRNINEERDKWKCTGGETAGKLPANTTLRDYNTDTSPGWPRLQLLIEIYDPQTVDCINWQPDPEQL